MLCLLRQCCHVQAGPELAIVEDYLSLILLPIYVLGLWACVTTLDPTAFILVKTEVQQ